MATSTSTMKEALVDKTLTVTIHDSPIPSPGPNQLLIRVVACGMNPKDWKAPELVGWPADGKPTNQGDDIAGYVEAMGEGVVGFHKGDKVAAFHQVMTPNGGYAEFALVWEHTTFHLAEATSFEEAATVPLAAITSALGLYQHLKLPLPWNPTTERIPLIIYGGATAVGAFAIKLAALSNIHPLIVVAGRGIPYVETLIDRSKGDTIIDYREGAAAVQAKLKDAAGNLPIHHAYDAVGEHGSHANIGSAMSAPGQITTMDLNTDYQLPEGIKMDWAVAGAVHSPFGEGKKRRDAEFGAALFQFMGRGLARGWFSGHPVEVMSGGLGGLQAALRDLKDGKASAVKYVVRIAETEGLGI
ncbi:GroES-like protein [Aspergillus pseudoustus]|uniref:GroES-like protein n=1 Tax=Aspergillus pseudoustus TaxID=1810923 RepID=A0ABR4I9Z4_9EURO